MASHQNNNNHRTVNVSPAVIQAAVQSAVQAAIQVTAPETRLDTQAAIQAAIAAAVPAATEAASGLNAEREATVDPSPAALNLPMEPAPVVPDRTNSPTPFRANSSSPPPLSPLSVSVDEPNPLAQSSALNSPPLPPAPGSPASSSSNTDQAVGDNLLEAPPTGAHYPSPEAALEYLNNFTVARGYALVVQRSNKRRRGSEVYKIYYRCDRGTTYEDQVAENERKRRNTGTRGSGCPFSAVLTHIKRLGEWELAVRNPNHNHEASSSARSHPSIRRDAIINQRERIATLSNSGVKPRSIMDIMLEENGGDGGDLRFKVQDVRNLRSEQRLQFLGGRAPIQALLIELQKTGEWIIEYEVDGSDHLTSLFFSHRTCIEFLRKYNNVLIMDCTYKTNRFRLPLLQIVGVTATNRTFHVAFAFIPEETTFGYTFPIRCLKSLFDRLEIHYPAVFLSDKETALRNTLTTIFPGSARLLCLWHINQNVLAHFARSIRTEVERDTALARQQLLNDIQQKRRDLMKSWSQVCFSETENQFHENWQKLKDEYADEVYDDCTTYLEREWLPHRQDFVAAWTKFHFHLGQISTSRAEGAHAAIKSRLDSCQGDMVTVVKTIELAVRNLHFEARNEIEHERVTFSVRHRTQLLNQVATRIAQHALKKVTEVQQSFLAKPENERPPCTHKTRTTLGVPCPHEILEKEANGHQHLTVDDFHPQWHLRSDDQSDPIDPRLFVQDPLNIRSRGRPSGALNNSTRRDPSGFEVLNRQASRGITGRGRQRRPQHQQPTQGENPSVFHESVVNIANEGTDLQCSSCRGFGHTRRSRRCPKHPHTTASEEERRQYQELEDQVREIDEEMDRIFG